MIEIEGRANFEITAHFLAQVLNAMNADIFMRDSVRKELKKLFEIENT
jgi:hypothetical protein